MVDRSTSRIPVLAATPASGGSNTSNTSGASSSSLGGIPVRASSLAASVGSGAISGYASPKSKITLSNQSANISGSSSSGIATQPTVSTLSSSIPSSSTTSASSMVASAVTRGNDPYSLDQRWPNDAIAASIAAVNAIGATRISPSPSALGSASVAVSTSTITGVPLLAKPTPSSSTSTSTSVPLGSASMGKKLVPSATAAGTSPTITTPAVPLLSQTGNRFASPIRRKTPKSTSANKFLTVPGQYNDDDYDGYDNNDDYDDNNISDEPQVGPSAPTTSISLRPLPSTTTVTQASQPRAIVHDDPAVGARIHDAVGSLRAASGQSFTASTHPFNIQRSTTTARTNTNTNTNTVGTAPPSSTTTTPISGTSSTPPEQVDIFALADALPHDHDDSDTF
jgi:hypothetical protein